MKSPETFLSYREMPSGAAVSHLVYSFWQFSVAPELKQPVTHEIFPDGCFSIFYYRNERKNFTMLGLTALSLELHKTEVFPGDVYWSARFSPAANRAILRANPAEFTSRLIFDENFLPHLTGGLLKELDECRNFGEAAAVYEKRFAAFGIASEKLDAKIIEAVRLIVSSTGEIKIAEIAEQLNLSVRQLQRRFLNATGLTPKQFARVQRWRATTIKLAGDTESKLVDCAAELGFTDQAHLSRECATLTGRSPKSFTEKVRQIEHGNLV
ncbi:MAG: hypothetical protein AVDCRST_MAG74-2585 [uncultured Pyrinomonadaceae bacterium]|uniref:HTH araC/xylS-type domain-containing protein n=1 Tax=uncultured Pyrinomonadaceae bacterium TaxID=2283094 RepID=A0A6J4PGK8_9BACT|nr:MAG: hypothetical protein AVDCRST_MAG74-2585 [uncultured Pyrinomonadaceae bacterium]